VKEWPWLKYIDIGESLRPGIAVVLFYHEDCPDCAEAIPLYEQMNSELAGSEDAIRIAFVEIPPFGDPEDSPIPPDSNCLAGKLHPEEPVFVTTPFVVVTVDGSVVNIWDGRAPDLDEILEAVLADDG